MTDYYAKYLKYKNKYLELKSSQGGKTEVKFKEHINKQSKEANIIPNNIIDDVITYLRASKTYKVPIMTTMIDSLIDHLIKQRDSRGEFIFLDKGNYDLIKNIIAPAYPPNTFQ